ncbi:MAG TPA: FlgD immunoglobulin-like domain containing protein [Chitinispirillaceae bacterium]|nr:FlgD immunoglobulin-like domain containing protein [Chitinispirillaceae bacterium]
MYLKKLIRFTAFLLFPLQLTWAVTIYVSQDGSGTFTTVQAAVDAAMPGDVIEITDLGTYNEQVTIQGKNNITIRSTNPEISRKPVIKYQDKTHVHPVDKQEYEAGIIDFDQNGALRIMEANNITIDGIIVDGGGPYPFAYPGIWGSSALFHGNGAFCLWVAGDVTIRNCEARNAYFGVNVKDRNEGGIFANANPNDLEPTAVVPLSGFGKTGNHLFEFNRFHDNSYGIFFESTWDLGSVVRYNLFYNNFHAPTTVTAMVNLPERDNQPGGALFFKDHLLSPLAIYNNTFWHNFINFAGQWRPGCQHLIFNNIYARPNKFNDSYFAMDKLFTYRMHNCIYAAQKETPQIQNQNLQDGTIVQVIRYLAIMNGVEAEKTSVDFPRSDGTTERINDIIVEGALLSAGNDGFPRSANIRWVEPVFQSEDPDDPQFLVPDWENPLMMQYIVDQGWSEAGIYDADGSVADLGRYPYNTTPSTTSAHIKPLDAVTINGNTATVPFRLSVTNGTFKKPKVKYVKWINNVEFVDSWASGTPNNELAAGDLHDVLLNPSDYVIGTNNITFTVPARTATQLYAFLELVLEGTDAAGQTVTSSVGFLPYRQLEYQFIVEVVDALNNGRVLDSVTAGQEVYLRITPVKIGTTVPIQFPIDSAEVSLVSGFDLKNHDEIDFVIQSGFTGQKTYPVKFTRVPTGSGMENVSARGRFTYTDGTQKAIGGISDEVKILPGPPESLEFSSPPSDKRKFDPVEINPGVEMPVLVNVYDHYSNLVSAGASVSLASLDPLIGDVAEPATALTNDEGAVTFRAQVTEGDLDQIFRLVATLEATGFEDTASLKVGQPKTRLWIFYDDVLNYDSSAVLRGAVGSRYLVTIVASGDGTAIDEAINKEIQILTQGAVPLVFYADQSGGEPTDIFNLVNGQAVVWVTATRPVNGGIITAITTDNSLKMVSRGNIYFTQSPLKIFYGEVLSPKDTLRGMAGERVRITIAASDGLTVFTDYNSTLHVKTAQNTPLLFYSTADDATPDSVFTLVNGQVEVWVTATGQAVNGSIFVTDVDTVLANASKNKIYFDKMPLYMAFDDEFPSNQAEIRGYVGMRYPVTIVTSLDGQIINTSFNNALIVSGGNSTSTLRFYASETAETADSVFNLVNGQVTVWVSSDLPVNNDTIRVRSVDNLLNDNKRGNVFFSKVMLYIYYDDMKDQTSELRGYVGTRYQVLLAASLDGETVATGYNNDILLNPLGFPFQFFASENDETPITSTKLTLGADTLWLGATAPVENGRMEASAPDSQLNTATRTRIHFTAIPLMIFFDDTVTYNPSAQINGSAGERFPVTIRATLDTITPLTNYQSELAITVSPDLLKIFASGDISDKNEISSISLINGQAVIWVTSYNPVSNGMIEVAPVSDASLAQGSRDGINFTKSNFVIEHAVATANNGFGRLDRLDLYYTTDLTAPPDSVQISWPDGSSTKTIIGAGIVLDDANPRHVTINLPDPFPEAVTTYTSSARLGYAFWSDPALAGQEPDRCPFDVKDSIGPLLTSAVLLQKFGSGNDIMFITLSESVSPSSLVGSSLLLKSSTGEVPINVLGAVAFGDTIRIVVEESASYKINPFDSLRINSQGNTVDVYGNRAHPENRPVVIQLRLVPPEIDSAFYADVYPDGFVDEAIIHFSAAVNLSSTVMEFTFDGTGSPELGSERFSYVDGDSSIVRVDLSGVFSGPEPRTSGVMHVEVTYTNFSGEKKNKDVKDRAAPVIKSANYCPGDMLDENSFAKDTIKVIYSENIAVTDGNTPLLLNQIVSGITGYTMYLRVLSQYNDQVVFVVDSIESGIRPTSSDSVWINVDGAVTMDAQGTVQTNPENRRVKLSVRPVKMKINVKVGPNPFNSTKPIVFIVDPTLKIADLVNVEARISIYDALGNVVFRPDPKKNPPGDTKVQFSWDGRNLKGRKVGNGTYMAVVQCKNLLTNERTQYTFMIAFKN